MLELEIGENDKHPSILDDKSLFVKKTICPAVRVNKRDCGKFSQDSSSRSLLLRLPKVKPIYDCPVDTEKRLICFDPAKVAIDFSDVPAALNELIESMEGAEKTTQEVCRGYESMSVDEIMAILVPEHANHITCAFETVGHIAHFNMREHSHPWRFVIARAVMDKNASIKTCVNKLSIAEKFRNLNLELIGGTPNFSARLRENGIQLAIEYDKVYWNTRLSNERTRLLELMQEGDVLCDAMAGIGAYAVHAAKKGLAVFANDLNPASAEGIKTNLTLNSIKAAVTADKVLTDADLTPIVAPTTDSLDSKVGSGQAFNTDGRAFIRRTADVYGIIPAAFAANRQVHFVMNLPEIAIEFVDAFRGIFKRAKQAAPELFAEEGKLPKVRVHVHCFARPPTHVEEIEGRVRTALGGVLPAGGVHVAEVRDVAPNKFMFCASFDVDATIGFDEVGSAAVDGEQIPVAAEESATAAGKRAAPEGEEEGEEVPAKAAKTDDEAGSA